VGTVHHNLVLVMPLYGVHTTYGFSRAVEHGQSGGLCTVLTCSWCVANFGSELDGNMDSLARLVASSLSHFVDSAVCSIAELPQHDQSRLMADVTGQVLHMLPRALHWASMPQAAQVM
jgi:hypothetical protein